MPFYIIRMMFCFVVLYRVVVTSGRAVASQSEVLWEQAGLNSSCSTRTESIMRILHEPMQIFRCSFFISCGKYVNN